MLVNMLSQRRLTVIIKRSQEKFGIQARLDEAVDLVGSPKYILVRNGPLSKQ